MTPRTTILGAFGPGECLTNLQLSAKTGRTVKNVSAWVAYLRERGELMRCTPERTVPVAHKKAEARPGTPDAVVQSARRQPTCVWDLGAIADRLGMEPFGYAERS